MADLHSVLIGYRFVISFLIGYYSSFYYWMPLQVFSRVKESTQKILNKQNTKVSPKEHVLS